MSEPTLRELIIPICELPHCPHRVVGDSRRCWIHDEEEDQ
jgi:hypothetical protein